MLPDTTSSAKLCVAVIGGGIAGLSATGFPQHPQYSIRLYEQRGADFKESSATLGMQTNGISIAKPCHRHEQMNIAYAGRTGASGTRPSWVPVERQGKCGVRWLPASETQRRSCSS